MNQDRNIIKITDIIENQIPEFINSENSNFSEFLKQYYISQEFQGSNIDLAENLSEYKNIDAFDSSNLIATTTLTSDIEFYDDVIYVNSTQGWPAQYGLLKINNEIITYTGIGSTFFTGCIRGFSGTSSLKQENNPEFLIFENTNADSHIGLSTVYNLSNLFLQEFFKKIKYQFTPGFEEVNFDSRINVQNFVSKSRSFYESKGTDEAFKILFKVLYGESVEILKPKDYTFTPSDDKWVICETFICELIEGNPLDLKGQTLYQDDFINYNINAANGSIYDVQSFNINDKRFYKLRIFSGYSNNLNPKGSINGTFASTPKTFSVENTSGNSTSITVDSTVGFANTGYLNINNLVITYQDKTNNQFLNCVGINTFIPIQTEVFSDHYVYAYEKTTSNQVIFKIRNVLSKLDFSDVTYAFEDDPIQIESFGSLNNSIFSKSLIYNYALSISCGKAILDLTTEIRQNQKEGFSINSGSCLSKYDHNLLTGDLVDIYDQNRNLLIAENLEVNVTSSKDFRVSVSSIQNINSLLGKNVTFKRKIKKSQFQNLNLTANIQDSYTDNNYNYLTSNGLPSYQINPLNLRLTYGVGGNYILTSIESVHAFVSGDALSVVSYNATSGYSEYTGISTGNIYYIKTFNQNQIALCRTRKDVENSTYLPLVIYDGNGNLSYRLNEIVLEPISYYNSNFNSSKLFKKFPKIPIETKVKDKTLSGSVGVFVNGIEIKNYKSFTKVYYGPITSFDILNAGKNYDLYNPPLFKIVYDGTAYNQIKINSHLKSKLIKLLVTDSGYDYVETPTVKVIGGNNNSVSTEVKMKYIKNEILFNASTKSSVVDVYNDSFIFNKNHRLITGEPIVYKTLGTFPIGIGTIPADGFLANESIYYVRNINSTTIKIANNKNDAINGNNLINLRTKGGGYQKFICNISKKVIDEVIISKNEKEFEYKKVSFISEDINFQDDIITIENHGFKNKEEVIYSYEPYPNYASNSISGLVLNTHYYILYIDKNRFKLTSTQDENTYVNLISADLYNIYFLEYPPVNIQILGNLTVSGISTVGYAASITSAITGSLVEARIQKSPFPIDFGNYDIINYEKTPDVFVLEGSGASLQPLIVNGSINEVVIKNSGSNYYNSINLTVNGEGFGAKLQSTIIDGKITNVSIVNGGVGYASSNTTISVNPIGSGIKLKANIKSWTIDEINKYNLTATSTNGIIVGKNYSELGKTFGLYYLNDDLRNYLQIGYTPIKHSPIVGWSYDGCPIYGPYGYENTNGTGNIVRMRSGYVLNNLVNGTLSYVEEYIFSNVGNLDEHNGRFCITPEYPNGVYAYFCTFNTSNVPEFPYVIGDTYNYKVERDNLNLKINQTIDFNNLNIIKNTKPYRFESYINNYDFFEFYPNSNDKDIIVTKTSDGSVDDIDVIDGGINYQIGDSIVFDNEGTSGVGAIAKVSEIEGVGVNSITSYSTSFSNVTFVYDGNTITGIGSTYHSFKNGFYINISGISSSKYQNITGFKKITIFENKTGLSTSLSSVSTTGILTSIKLKESIFTYDIDSQIKIGDEIVKVIGLDYQNNLINVLRPASGTDHTVYETVELLQNKFYFNDIGISPTFSEINQSYYFNPSESVAIGTDTSVGIGTTLSINPLGAGISYTKYIRTGGIYLPNNKFKNGEKITYTSGISTIVSNLGYLNSIENLYMIKFENDVVGLVTNTKDISTYNNILTFTSPGSGKLHKFTTNRNIVTANVTENTSVVSTASTHGLISGDVIDLNIKSGITTTYYVTYSPSTNRLLINSQVNPFINLYRNSNVIFDISDNSLSNTDFNLYTDEYFQNKYFANIKNNIEVTKSLTQLILSISDHTPSILYYNLSSISKIILPNESIQNNNQLSINNSLYNGNSFISTSTDKTFTFNLKTTPERLIYLFESDISYNVLSSNTLGPIFKLNLISRGSGYKKIPNIFSIHTKDGTGSSLIPISQSIGKIIETKVNNTNFVCLSDKTLKPQSKAFSTLNLNNNFTVTKLDLISGGSKYISSPTIKLFNYKENQIISNFSASAILKNSSINEVSISNPGYGLNPNDNKIVLINNTNGIEILNVSATLFNPYTVTLTLKTPTSGFTTSNPMGIYVGDKIFVEGIQSDGGSGYNSSNYRYIPFVVTYADPAYNSQDAAIVRYELNTYPGNYNQNNTSYASVIAFNDMPIIDATLDQNIFQSGESISNSTILNNFKNNPIRNLIKVKNSDNISLTNVITGSYSKSKGKIIKIQNYNNIFLIDSSVSEILGGMENKGYLSSNIQKISDNDYYQSFSYSLKSKKQFVDWNPIISDLSHISGYKKFADLLINSFKSNSLAINNIPYTKTNVILLSYANINSIHDLDLVNEEDIDYTNGQFSQYIKFNSLKLGESLLSTNNRVLSIDDISKLFINQQITPSIKIDQINLLAYTTLKYQIVLNSTQSFLGNFVYPQTFELFITKDFENYYLTSYAYFYDPKFNYSNPYFGNFTLEPNINDNTEPLLKFTPNNPYLTISIQAIRESANISAGIATTSVGYAKNIEITENYAATESPTSQTFYSIPSSTCSSGTLIVGISSISNFIESSFEASFVSSGGILNFSVYAENSLKNLGTIDIVDNGSNVEFKYTGISGIGVTVYTNLKLLTNTYSGYDTLTKTISRFSSQKIITNISGYVAISTVSQLYQYSKYIIEIKKTVGVTTQKSLIQLNSIYFNDYLNHIQYNQIGEVDSKDLKFETIYDDIGQNYILYFIPTNSASYELTIYQIDIISPQ